MESLRFTCEEGELPFTDDIELSMDGLVRGRNVLKGCDAETLFVPIRDISEGLAFVEPSLPGMTRMPVVGPQCLENSLDDANCDSCKSVTSTSTITPNTIEFGTRFYSSAIKTDHEKLKPTSLKIENLAAPGDLMGRPVSIEDPVLSAHAPSVSSKRAQVANFQSQIPVCIVYGCNKDLSSSKEYYRRHKVCQIHSKTAVVIVNGIRQRFCQQCSRFHRLAEFDDGKRSCRKRLAGHNKRRRKPQLDTHFDSMFFETDIAGASFLSSKNLRGGFFDQLFSWPANLSRHITGCSFSKSPWLLNEFGKQYPSKNCPNSPLSVLELFAGSNSSCAHSLLSAQSQGSLSNSAGISTDHPLVFKEYHHSNLAFNQSATNFRGISSSSSGEVDQRILDASFSVGFRTPQNELSQESSTILNLKSYPSLEDSNTVDLLQLSLHLQRVEHEKHWDQVKLESGIICHPNTT